MLVFVSLIISLVSATSVSIIEPIDGENYDGNWLPFRAIVENENEVPDSVHYSLNGESVVSVPRLNTDWYTYMANDLHTGFSESSAPHEASVLWTAPVCGTFHEFCSPVIVDEMLYFSSLGDTTVYALDPVTGIELWSYKLSGWVDDAVTVKDNRVYLTADSTWCLDSKTGEKYWAFAEEGALGMIGTSPVVVEDIVYVCSDLPGSFALHALSRDTGSEIWRVEYAHTMMSCITYYEGMIFVRTWEGPLYALDALDGGIIWTNYDSENGYWDSSPTVYDGSVFITGDGTLRINTLTGVTEWMSGIGYGDSTPAIHNGVVFTSGYNGDCLICAFDAISGDTVWTHSTDYLHGSTGVADGLVFYGDNLSGTIFALDELTGEEMWSYSTVPGTHGIGSSPAITDGVMYLACTDGYLYAFGTGLKYTYLDDLYAQVGSNELIVTSYYGGAAVAADNISFTVTGTGINLDSIHQLNLSASPNPFVLTASLSFNLPVPGYTTVNVFDLAGRCVTTLLSAELISGSHTIQWNGRDDSGVAVSAGLYLCSIQSGRVAETTELCLLR